MTQNFLSKNVLFITKSIAKSQLSVSKVLSVTTLSLMDYAII